MNRRAAVQMFALVITLFSGTALARTPQFDFRDYKPRLSAPSDTLGHGALTQPVHLR